MLIAEYVNLPYRWKCISQLSVSPSTACAYIPSSHDALLAVGIAKDSGIQLLKARDGTVEHTLTGHTKNIHKLLYSPMNNVLISASEDRSVALWKINPLQVKESSLLETVQYGYPVDKGVLSRCEKFCALMVRHNEKSLINILSVQSGHRLDQFFLPGLLVVNMTWNLDATALSFFGYAEAPSKKIGQYPTRTVMVDIKRKAVLHEFRHPCPIPACVAYLPHKNLLYVDGCGGDLSIISASNGSEFRSIRGLAHPHMRAMEVSPESRSIAIISRHHNDRTARLAILDTETECVSTPLRGADQELSHSYPLCFPTEDHMLVAGSEGFYSSTRPNIINVIRRLAREPHEYFEEATQP